MDNKKIFLVISVLLVSILSNIVSADVLPGGYDAATLNFLVKYENETVTPDFRANLMICRQGDCSKIDNSVLCAQGVCLFNYYRVERVPREMKLQLIIDDKTFNSNIFNFSEEKAVNEYYYAVSIKPDGDMIISNDKGEIEQYKEKLGIDNNLAKSQANYHSLLIFVFAILLTMLIELIVLVYFLKRWKIKKWKKMIVIVILANIISIPLVWLSFLALMIVSVLFATIIVESFAIVFEAVIIYFFNKKQIKLKQSFILSFAMNLASFLLGGVMLMIIRNLII